MNYDLVGIGNALVDIEVQVDDAFIKEISVTKGGMTLTSAAEQKKILQTLQSKPQKLSSGGSSANTIHGASVLGAKSYYLGRVANDDNGKHYTEDMQSCGVGFCGPGSDNGGTGTCLILITPDAERTMLTNLGVSSLLHADNVDATIIQNAKAVYVEGYLWTADKTRAAGIRMARVAKERGVPVAFTLSDAFVVNSFQDSLRDFIRWNVDILFCNEAEARAMTGGTDARQAFDKLSAWVGTLFLTLGAKGSLIGKSGHEPTRVGVLPVAAVDTTGAGDLYAAGALYGLMNHRALKDAAVIGAYCAAQVISHFGGRLPTHSHTRIENILAEYRKHSPPIP